MKTPEYIEGPDALKNFERGMIALFKVPKTSIGKARKKGRKLTAPRKAKRAANG
jgi:exonuclease VII small subunit